MSQFETLMARDGHAFSAYIARPAGHARGAVVVVQEIFGLTAHIRRLADSYAADGYLAVAPALYDRVRRDLVLGHSPAEIERARGYRKQIDNSAGRARCRGRRGDGAPFGQSCAGRLLLGRHARLDCSQRSCRSAPRCATTARGIAAHLAKTPSCPTLLHFGERDTSIPPADVERIRAAYPQGIYNLYAAGHGFSNEDRPDAYDAAAAALARSRTHAFLSQHIG